MDEARLYSWFLGPKAENGDILEQLVLEAVRDTVFWRRNFHPEDESLISQAAKRDDAFQDSIAVLHEHFLTLLANLKRDVPFFSPRYIGHMLGDQLLAAMLGYFAAMLHNPNNVSLEGSPITTACELEVAQQLARLVGYEKNAWGHITSGGTLANCEALWVARNLKYFPLAVQTAARELKVPSIPIQTCDGRTADLVSQEDSWSLLNLDPEEVVNIRSRLYSACSRDSQGTSPGASEKMVDEILLSHSLSGKGIHRLASEWPSQDLNPASVLMPATAHYSLQKVVELLGLGRGQIEFIPVDGHFRMDMDGLRKALDRHLEMRRPVVALVSVLGSTEEGSVDYLHEILRVQEEYKKKGICFYHHCDGAWGGYVRSLFFDAAGQPVQDPGAIVKAVGLWPSDEVFESFQALGRADSVTIDPHKLGYVPYPCGAVVFRNEGVRDFISFDAPYLFRQEGSDRPLIGRYILEGSKPGASAASCWLAHKVVPLNQSGYGQLIGRSIQGAQELYLKFSKDLAVQLKRQGIQLHAITDPPDLNLFCFIVNKEGNKSLEKMNALNRAIFEELKFKRDEVIQRHDFIISSTDFLFSQYGKPRPDGSASMDEHLARLGIATEEFREVKRIKVLRCTIVGPWLALARGGKPDYIASFAAVLKDKIEKTVREQFGQ